MIKITNLSKSYGTVKALNNINLEISENRIIGLLGPNGSGKSTLIKILNGLLKEDSGIVLIDGFEIGVSSKEIISYLPERTYLDNNLTVSETISFFKDFYKDFSQARAYKLVEDLKIDPNKKIKTLSKGNKEKVQLILVVSRDARYYILDEPIAGVDPATRDYILETVLNNLSINSTLIISTHLIADIESYLNEVIIIKEGNIIYNGDKLNLLKDYESLDEWFRREFRHV
ncbi:ABC transporter ATP-binding protein [Haploplasma modicum]|uniref:ABC transporter ATP-binding protein n=1 Tax=Haploplasma modicum TaxID=2150 RepID=UPI00214B2084|nr:ABC transporter ATP-binding protein [Haploplasma modicum]MCR1808737.1 ABC transporter ATP-binding protein [Haploplasma modicum]